jgi:hypothetical protein
MIGNRQSRRMSWNTHSILTREALRSTDSSILDRKVVVQELEEFLEPAEAPLKLLVKWYWNLLDRKVGTGSNVSRHLSPIRNRIDFLKALRLNPGQDLPFVRVLRPSEIPVDAPHDPSRAGPPGGAHVETRIQESLDVRDILCTFADEPDWGMDQDLYEVAEYGYGSVPFGPSKGPSSQACFHMAFLRENPILLTVLPGLGRSFMEERIRVFLALAGLAFSLGKDYWGWRFSAWAMHYLQDLTQPYHALCLPLPKILIVRRFLQDPRPTGFQVRNKNLLTNRHALFEVTVHFMLNDAVKKGTGRRLFRCLAGNGDGAVGTLRSVMEEMGASAASLATRADRAVVRLMNDPRIRHPEYHLVDEEDYPVEERLNVAAVERPLVLERFHDIVCRCLLSTGRATRYVLSRTELVRARDHSHFSTISPSNPT